MNENDKVTIHPSSQFAGFYKKLPQRTEIKEYLQKRNSELWTAIRNYREKVSNNEIAIRQHTNKFTRQYQTKSPGPFIDKREKLRKTLKENQGTLRWLQGRQAETDQTLQWLEGQKSEVNNE